MGTQMRRRAGQRITLTTWAVLRQLARRKRWYPSDHRLESTHESQHRDTPLLSCPSSRLPETEFRQPFRPEQEKTLIVKEPSQSLPRKPMQEDTYSLPEIEDKKATRKRFESILRGNEV